MPVSTWYLFLRLLLATDPKSLFSWPRQCLRLKTNFFLYNTGFCPSIHLSIWLTFYAISSFPFGLQIPFCYFPNFIITCLFCSFQFPSWAIIVPIHLSTFYFHITDYQKVYIIQLSITQIYYLTESKREESRNTSVGSYTYLVLKGAVLVSAAVWFSPGAHRSLPTSLRMLE